MTKTIPKKKKYDKAKWLPEKVLQITEKRKVKGKEESEIYNKLNAEFQRIARRAKKDFLSEKCKKKKKDGNNRMGKTRDLFKKIGDINGILHSEMDKIKTKMAKT